MPSSDTWFKTDESKPKNAFLKKKVEEYGSVRKLAKAIGVPAWYVSNALNKRYLHPTGKIKIAKFFGKDTIEIFF